MITEIFGFLIIAGAVIVFALRHHLQREKEADAEEMAVSTKKLRYELEHSADEIIDRMAAHMDRLEKLIVEADQRIGQLDVRLEELKRREEQRGTERADVESFSRLLHASVAEPEPFIEPEKEQVPVEAVQENDKPAEADAGVADTLPETNTKRARELLQEGYSNEEIAKETGMGRGAIELVRQMEKRKK